jgi:serine/threonine-protein kinase
LLQLSWVNLALNRKVEALRLAHQAITLVPVEKDALLGPTYLACLAEIEGHAREPDEAIKTLQQLLAMPIGLCISIQQLKIDPVWDAIRNHPGFQQLLLGKESVGANR